MFYVWNSFACGVVGFGVLASCGWLISEFLGGGLIWGGVVDLVVGLGCFLGWGGIRVLQVCVCGVWVAFTCEWVLGDLVILLILGVGCWVWLLDVRLWVSFGFVYYDGLGCFVVFSFI